mmetsp:Transcript_16264/g.51011  ORF Transcript_16264/g.51011 Transcript_16264/m.51011 type:complete len:95 (-) Transcript_16264:2891-3175(-)
MLAAQHATAKQATGQGGNQRLSVSGGTCEDDDISPRFVLVDDLDVPRRFISDGDVVLRKATQKLGNSDVLEQLTAVRSRDRLGRQRIALKPARQ